MTDEIRTISKKDENFPKLLREIKDAPEILYYRGNSPKADENCFAVVGTRRCSDYGKQMALEIAGDLAEAGLTIISGLAPGIDTLAHQACVERNKRTIAVLGTGVDDKTIYPQTNVGLAHEILENGGCVISEYAPETEAFKSNFPARNRIVSGMSLGVLVVEAKENSGSLITAGLATKQKKLLFAIPGNAHFLNAFGPNWLIKTGRAKLVESARDILGELKKTKQLKLNLKKESKFSGENQEENLILEALKEGSQDINKIIIVTKLPPALVSSTLAILEIKNKVRNLGGNTYALKG
jgi:DNA processing protein